MLSHQGLQPVHVGSGQVGDLGLVLNEDEGRHGGDLRKNWNEENSPTRLSS